MFRALVFFFLIGVGSVSAASSLDSIPLIKMDSGKWVPFSLKKETRYVAFYYSASWCGPCRKTSPALVAEYQRMLDRGEMPVEIVLVGRDESLEKMQSYMKHYGMVWPAVAWEARGMVDQYAARGIPHFVLVKRDTGEVIAHGTGLSGVESVVNQMRKFSKVDAKSSFKAQNWLSQYGVLLALGGSFLVIVLYQKWKDQQEVKNL